MKNIVSQLDFAKLEVCFLQKLDNTYLGLQLAVEGVPLDLLALDDLLFGDLSNHYVMYVILGSLF